MDFTSLKAAVNTWATRAYSDEQLNEFVELAEANIRRRLVGYQREETVPLAADADGVIALPSDFLGMRSVYYGDRPYQYNISGSDFTVRDGAGYTFDVTYFTRLPALASDNPTNWLIDVAPDVYLWMVKAQAREFNEEWELATGLEGKALQAISDLNLQSTVAQYSRTGLALLVHD